ncbi:MAG: hypothetical protein FWE47_04135 [Oscillospiraceae bacterium]|nr:hypothetical protein [Oscillospiraceae bacterium]
MRQEKLKAQWQGLMQEIYDEAGEILKAKAGKKRKVENATSRRFNVNGLGAYVHKHNDWDWHMVEIGSFISTDVNVRILGGEEKQRSEMILNFSPETRRLLGFREGRFVRKGEDAIATTEDLTEFIAEAKKVLAGIKQVRGIGGVDKKTPEQIL